MSIAEYLDPREWAVALCGSDAKSKHLADDERVPMVEQRGGEQGGDRKARVAELQAEMRALREQLAVAHEARELAEAKAKQHMSLRKAVAELVPTVASRTAADASMGTEELLQLVQAHLAATGGEGSAAGAAAPVDPLGGAVPAPDLLSLAEPSLLDAAGGQADGAQVQRLEQASAAQQAELARVRAELVSVKGAAAGAHSRAATLQSMLDSATLRATRAENTADAATQRADTAVAAAEARLAAQAAQLEANFATAVGEARRQLAGGAAEQARMTQHRVKGLIKVAKVTGARATAASSAAAATAAVVTAL